MSSPIAQMADGPPYSSPYAGLGGLPTTTVDAPITAVFLLLFVVGAAIHMTILQLNQKRSHKFLASGALFGLCMARIMTCTMRLVWSTHQTSVPIAIAANVFVSAGVIIVIIINLIFAQRILRASHPAAGWHRITHYLFTGYYFSIILMLAALITSIVQQSYSLDGNTRRIDHDIQLVGGTYNAAAAFLPIPIVIFGVVLPKLSSKPRRVEKFGTGRFRTKILVILLSTFLIALGAAFRAGIAYVPRPPNDPAWYHSRACFYIFTLGVEVIVIYMYAAVRVDRRFHIPDGASGPGGYAAGKVEKRIATEEEFLEVFTPEEDDGVTERQGETNGRTVGSECLGNGHAEKWETRAEAELQNGIKTPPAARVA